MLYVCILPTIAAVDDYSLEPDEFLEFPWRGAPRAFRGVISWKFRVVTLTALRRSHLSYTRRKCDRRILTSD